MAHADPPVDHDGIAASLRARLAAVDYSSDGIQAALRAHGPATPLDTAVQLRRVAGRDARSVLIRLLYLSTPIPQADADAAFAPLKLVDLKRIGVLSVDTGVVRPLVRLVPAHGLLIGADAAEAGIAPADHVPPPNPSSAMLAALTMREQVGSTLDLGCGSGLQALLAARHSDAVTAVDVNPRALAFTAFNAALNGIANIELLEGDWLRPVGGRRFDLIVANPPFVVSPDATLLFRDAEQPGDRLCRTLVGEIPAHLETGGHALIMCDWGQRAGEQWWEPIERWVESTGCDAWILHFGTADPVSYAASANWPLKAIDAVEFERTLDRWIAYYRGSGIAELSSGAVVLRRRDGPNWRRMASVSVDLMAGCGGHVIRMLRGEDLLAELADDERLLDAPIVPVEQHVIDQRLSWEEGEYRMERPAVRSISELGLAADVDVAVMQTLLQLPTARSLRVAAVEAATALGLPAAEVRHVVLPAIRRLIQLGLVDRRAGDAGDAGNA